MKKFFSFLSILLMTTVSLANNDIVETRTNNTSLTDDLVKVIPTEAPIKAYYFHSSRRCATCFEVENVTAKTIKDNFSDKYKINLIPTQKFIDQNGKKDYRHEGFSPKRNWLNFETKSW